MKRKRLSPRAAGGALRPSITAEAVSNLPQIPGLRIEQVPSFLHVLRVTAKFFQTKPSKQPFTLSHWDRLANETVNEQSGGDNFCAHSDEWNSKNKSLSNLNAVTNVRDALLHRMESVSNNSGLASATASEFNDHKKRLVETVKAWIEEVKILALQRKQQQSIHGASMPALILSSTGGNLENQQPPEENNASQPIPYSMFLYLWELQQQHKRVTVRRSALFLSGLLLLRSKDCRHYLTQETCLAEWISSFGADSNDITLLNSNRDSSGLLQTDSNRKIFQQGLLQKEAVALISHLVDKGFGKMYPKLSVAKKSLQHLYTNAFTETSKWTSSDTVPLGMANWRNLRDFAFLHGHKEVKKVTKLLDRANECLEILVPRIGGIRHHFPSSFNLPVSEEKISTKGQILCADKNLTHIDNNDKISNVDDTDESDEGSIDWEDGDEIDCEDAKQSHNDQNLHLSAVERTMAVMKKTSETTLFSGGKLEIDFDRRIDGDYGNARVDIGTNNQVLNMKHFEQKLEMIVQKLSNKHLVRLTAWLDGLRNADSLRRTESASLVSISQEKNILRHHLISIISELKQDISSVISSASRLNIQAYKGPDEFHRSSAQIHGKHSSGMTLLQKRGRKVVTARGKAVSSNCVPKKSGNHRRCRKIKIELQNTSISIAGNKNEK